LLIVLGLTVVSAAFHECGHATGCRYGVPGLAWSASDLLIWRRSGNPDSTGSAEWRLRTDLVLVLQPDLHAARGLYAATSAEVLLLVIAITHLEMLGSCCVRR
jgi:putative peptide zinc metalloprotease protein